MVYVFQMLLCYVTGFCDENSGLLLSLLFGILGDPNVARLATLARSPMGQGRQSYLERFSMLFVEVLVGKKVKDASMAKVSNTSCFSLADIVGFVLKS